MRVPQECGKLMLPVRRSEIKQHHRSNRNVLVAYVINPLGLEAGLQ